MNETPEIKKDVRVNNEIKPVIKAPAEFDSISDREAWRKKILIRKQIAELLGDDKFKEALGYTEVSKEPKPNDPEMPPLTPDLIQEPQKEYPLEQWKKDLARLIRRAAIGRYLKEAKSQDEVKAAVRKFESEIGVKDMIDDFAMKEVNVPPALAKTTAELYEKIKLKVPKVQAIILLGSSVHGGAKIREAMENEQEPDLDWFVISESDDFTSVELDTVMQEANSCLPQIAHENGLSPTFHSCKAYNPLAKPDIHSLKDTQEVFSLIYNDSFFQQQFILYLQPSFPPQVNERNRAILQKALDELYEQDRDKWEFVITEIMDEWKDAHDLKPKHFSETLQDWHDFLWGDDYIKKIKASKDFGLSVDVVDHSADIMSQPLAESLRSVSKKEEHKQ